MKKLTLKENNEEKIKIYGTKEQFIELSEKIRNWAEFDIFENMTLNYKTEVNENVLFN